MNTRSLPSRIIAILLSLTIPLGTAPISQETAPSNGPAPYNFRQKIFGDGVTDGVGIPDSGTNNQASLSYPSPITGRVGVALSAGATAAGLASPVSFAVTTGALPGGIQIDPATGAISGAPTAAGTYGPVTVTATGSDASATAGVTFAITEPTISYPALTAATEGQATTISPTQANMSANSFALIGSPPDGMTFGTSTGVLSGAPTTQGTWNFYVQATASDGASALSNVFQVTVGPAPTVQSATMASITGQVGTFASGTPSASGFSATPTWTLSSAAPFGLSLNPATGAISGTPTSAGTATGLTLTATAGAQSAVTAPFQISIAAPLATAAMANVSGTASTFLTATPTSANFSTAPTWALTGTLPAGLNLNTASGAISGTPSAAGTTNGLVLTATAGAQTASTSAFSITIAPGAVSALALTYPTATGTRGTSTTLTPSTTGAVGGVTYALAAGTLPAGMSLNPASGVISGTPTTATTYAGIQISATDAQKTVTTPSFSITISAPTATSPGAQTANGGASFTSAAPTTNVPNPTWTLASGSLPSGLTLNSSTGVISGTVPAGAGNFTVSLTATNGGATATTSTFTTTVRNVSTPSGSLFSQGVSGTHTYAISGLTGTPTWSVTSGALPAGLTLSTGGVLSGMPTATGVQPPFTVSVTTTTGFTASAPPTTLTFAPLFTVNSMGNWTVGQWRGVIAVGFAATAPNPNPWTFAYDGAELPPGVYHSNTANGSFAGTPSQTGTYAGLKFRATNGTTGAVVESPEFSITVVAAPGAPLALRQYEDGVVVRARGYETVLTARLETSDALYASINSSRTLYVQPNVTAAADGRINGSLGITRAPWQAAGLNGAYLDGSSNSAFGWIQPSAAATATGSYSNLSFIVSDTQGGVITGPRTGRTGFIGPFTLKIFDAYPASSSNNSWTPTSISPASGTVLTAGTAGDMNFSFDVYGIKATINCTVGQTASYRVHSLLPDGTWARMMTKVNQVCPAGGSYSSVIDADMVGIGQKFRVTVDAGQITWTGGKIDSNGATRTP